MSCKIMQYAVLLHLTFGFYMFSNSSIFSVSASFISSKIQTQNDDDSYFSSKRMSQTHAIIYLTFLVFIFIVFVTLEIISCYCADIWNWKKICCCCKKNNKNNGNDKKGISDSEREMEIQSFSNNIYAELGSYDLKNEYKKTKTEL